VIGAGMSEEQLERLGDRIRERARSAGGGFASAAMGVATAPAEPPAKGGSR